jgi:hypothetical protein
MARKPSDATRLRRYRDLMRRAMDTLETCSSVLPVVHPVGGDARRVALSLRLALAPALRRRSRPTGGEG